MEVDPVEAVSLQDDSAAIPLAGKVMMNGCGEDKITVGREKQLGRIIGVIGDVRVAEHIRLFAGLDTELTCRQLIMKRRIGGMLGYCMMAILTESKSSSGKIHFRRAESAVSRKSFGPGNVFYIFVSATKDIQKKPLP